jgi:cytochrome c553
MHTKSKIFIHLFLFSILVVACQRVPVESRVVPSQSEWVERGGSIVRGLAACGFCHGEADRRPDAVLIGGQKLSDRYGEVIAPNLTPHRHGLKDWKDEDIIRVLRGGLAPNNREVSDEMHEGYQWMSDSDLFAVASYLRSLPPLPGKSERREIGCIARNTVGFLDVNRENLGGVPEIPRRFNIARGKYLVDHVARCSSCHNSPGSEYSGVGYLSGGRVFKYGSKEQRIAPSLEVSSVTGLRSWDKAALVRFLRSGETVDGRYIDNKFCPVAFYKNAEEQDLLDIASFLLKGSTELDENAESSDNYKE